jgi:DNA polymerase-3 subunit alpha
MIFNHLHCHTQYSLLDGAASIAEMYSKAKNDGMRAIAITDHGNMFGVFDFVAQAGKHEGIKPIVGCEFYVVADRHKRAFTGGEKDRRYHQLFLAKNPKGYQNLVKMCSLGFIEGLYGKYPRIDKELVLQYHEGLIATTCCLGALVPQTILTKGEEAARKEFEWWLNIFGDDYYIELQRHHLQDQQTVNEVLLRFAKDYNVKMIASNDSHYVDRQDANAHDILLCINTGEKQATPKMDDFTDDNVSQKGKRFAFANDEFYFKNTAEMTALFKDLPEAIDNTNEIVDKIEPLKLKRDILLPHFQIPEGFSDQDEYLRYITYKGAYQRYGEELPLEVTERLDFELFTVKTMGFAGYFLIVADFIKAGRDLGVFVGPGRGSAAGSAVAYCIGITNIDPIKYNLLFERFLNPDRKSMPDIDTDFDDEGRQKVIDYVVDKYGKQQVAHIVTYGTMAAKMSIKDVARVLDLPLTDANAIAKLVPEKPGIKLKRLINAPMSGEGGLTDKESLNSDEMENVRQLRELHSGNDMRANVLREALILEGSVRGTGIHAAGIIIAPSDLSEIIPVAAVKDVNLYITQFEGGVIEDAGVIKMDFLGLKTLTIMRDALQMIKENHGIAIDIDTIPLDDAKTYELYQRGDTNGTFQFESAGMQKHLRDLKPDCFEDLIAMNALYRPGPLEYIPNYIARKHGTEKVVYDLPEMEEYLSDTYGICVYQEQVMLLSQKMAGFSKGDADVLRKAMGKKQIAVLNKMKVQFLEGCAKKGLDTAKCEKVWTDWEAFASYAFNKSHSTCYAFVAYQTAYLKAHYPAEYMAAVLTHNQSNIDKITFFMDESRRMGIPVKGPDVNESGIKFSVNKKGEIRYGLGAIKGVGEAALEEMIAVRKKDGAFKSLFDMVKRVSLRTVNKKVMENLAYAGAFDGFAGIHRAQYFHVNAGEEVNLLEKALRFGNQYQSSSAAAAVSLFGGGMMDTVKEPDIPKCAEWSLVQKLKHERETIGVYLTGHPLDDYKPEIQGFCTCALKDMERYKGKEVAIGCMVTAANHRTGKNGNPFGNFTLEDFDGTYELSLFGNDYVNFKNFFEEGQFLFIRGRYIMNYRGSDFELKINQVSLLLSLRDQVRRITLPLPLAAINDKLTDQLEMLCKKYKGNATLQIKIIDAEAKYSLLMRSKTYKLKPDIELYKTLNALNIDFKVGG